MFTIKQITLFLKLSQQIYNFYKCYVLLDNKTMSERLNSASHWIIFHQITRYFHQVIYLQLVTFCLFIFLKDQLQKINMKLIIFLSLLFVYIHSLALCLDHKTKLSKHQSTGANPSSIHSFSETQPSQTNTFTNNDQAVSYQPQKIGPNGIDPSLKKQQIKKQAVGSKKQTKAKAFYSNDLTLSLDYAVREKTCFYSAQFQVYWNNVKITEVIPTDYEVHTLTFKLTANKGKNILAFAGTGLSDGRGATLANIKIIRKSSLGLQDLVDNGDFQQGKDKIGWTGAKIFKGNYPGWKGKQIEVGKGTTYSQNWPADVIVTELDANQNTKIEQSFYFLDNYQVFYEVDLKQLLA